MRDNRKGIHEKGGKVSEIIRIEERPAQVANRSLPGHWQGDFIIGKGHKTALGTIVERKAQSLILALLKA